MLIRDPVHGDVHLSALETRVLDLPELQRLRGIKQLGTASLVYPGCVHTRFDHSLGACAAAHRIIDSLRNHGGAAIEAALADLIGCAALLHDVTHVPFGHTLEDERRLFPRHDKGTRLARLLDGPLGEHLARLQIKEPIAALLGAASPAAVPRWARQIVASTIDADLLDYLRRDAYFAGLRQDYDDRIYRYFTIDDGQLAINMTKHGMERPDARSETVALLRLRYFLTERVYYHHTKVAAGAMISKAVELAIPHGITDASLLTYNDWTLLDSLARVPDHGISDLVDGLRQRRLYKRGYALSAHSVGEAERARLVARFHESPTTRAEAEATLARALGCPPHAVIVYCPALTVMKEAAVLVRRPDGLAPLNRDAAHHLAEIAALEARYAALWRLYVFVPPELTAGAARAAHEFFGSPSEFRAP
ncbi:MAG TPA: HD domain-containing protein [Candidatus Binatia bacterium]|nr:HD domain-containing protein [Candidatus Binatia bacterium]